MKRECAIMILMAAALAVTGAAAGPALPGVQRHAGNVYLVENHSTAYLVWHALGIRNATLVHIDTHDDCRSVSDAKLEALGRLAAAGDFDGIYARSDLGFQFRFEVSPDDLLFDIGSFVYPCVRDGTIGRFIWVIPDLDPAAADLDHLQAHLAKQLAPAAFTFRNRAGGFSFDVHGCPVIVTTLAALEPLPSGALLDLDIDFFAFRHAMDDRHLPDALVHDPEKVLAVLRARVPAPAAVTVSSSVPGGYLPLTLRFLADAGFDVLTGKPYPAEARALLSAVTVTRRTGEPADLPPAPGPAHYAAAHAYLGGLHELMRGNPGEAAAALERAARLVPVYAKALIDASEAMRMAADADAGEQFVARYEAMVGDVDTLAVGARAHLHRLRGDLVTAERLARRLVDWSPDNHHRLLLGGICFEAGKLAAAAEQYGLALARQPRHAGAAYNLALVEERLGQDDKAVRHYRQAIERRPDFLAAHENLGLMMMRRGDLEAARRHLEAARSLNPLKTSVAHALEQLRQRRAAAQPPANEATRPR